MNNVQEERERAAEEFYASEEDDEEDADDADYNPDKGDSTQVGRTFV